MKAKVLVFGAGLIGSFISNTLLKNYTVYNCDCSQEARRTLKPGTFRITDKIYTVPHARGIIDLARPDVVVNALPGRFGLTVFLASLDAGVDGLVDISFFKENPLDFNDLAKETGTTAVVDFGFAPGFSHMFVGRANKLLEGHHSSMIYVAGLQKGKESSYKAVFSPEDIVEEYTRPARYLKDGKLLTEPPFERNYSYKHWSCFINDGLRTLVENPLPGLENLKELTMRPTKHFWFMQQLLRHGFFEKEQKDSTAKLLAQAWKLSEKDRDKSILDVFSQGTKQNAIYSMYDEYDETNQVHSMARVTGFPVIAMVHAMVDGYEHAGIQSPEMIAQDDDLYNFVVQFLQEQDITIKEAIYDNEEYKPIIY